MRNRETIFVACSNCSETKEQSEMIETDNDYFCDEECKDDFEEGTI